MQIHGMPRINHVDFEKAQQFLMRYHKTRNIKYFNMFVSNGARQFIVFIASKKLGIFRKEMVRDLEQEAANIVLIRLTKPRKKPITTDAFRLKNYLYTAAVNVSYDLIKKYKLYENENMASFGDKAYGIKSPEYRSVDLEAMEIIYEKLLYYFTQEMETERMNPYQAYVFMETIKGHSCMEISENMPDRKFETIKSDLRGARRVLRGNCVSREKIMEIIESSRIKI